MLNLSGTHSHNTLSVPGLNAATFSQSTQPGSLAFIFNPGFGIYDFTAHSDLELTVSFLGENGMAAGILRAGQNWQIDDPINRRNQIEKEFRQSTGR